MSDVEVIQGILLFNMALILTVFALILDEDYRKVILQYLAALLWLVNGLIPFIAGDVSSGLTFAASYLFFGFAFIFVISAFYGSFQLVKLKRGQQV